MQSPQDRVIKKMIDGIVEGNKPHFEHTDHVEHHDTTSNAPKHTSEDNQIISRKIEYGFSTMQREHAEMRKMIEDFSGAIKMLRSDIEMLRSMIHQRPSQQSTPAQAPAQASSSVGAPQYRKSDADEAYERSGGQPSDPVPPNQHASRGSQKDGSEVDLGKVFYYGKK